MLTHPHAKPEAVSTADCTPIMSELRIVKEDSEIEALRRAARVAVAGMDAALQSIKEGVTESQVAAEAEYAMRQNGAVDFYRSCVSSGPRSSIAHGIPSLRKLQEGDMVMIDIHPVVDGYTSDNVVIAIGNCGPYTGAWGIRIEDTVMILPFRRD